MDMQSEFDRLLFFEHARKTAEANYAKDPLDAEVCFHTLSPFFYYIFSTSRESRSTSSDFVIIVLLFYS